jgi:hypothetical protein
LQNMTVEELLQKKRKKREALHTGPRQKLIEACPIQPLSKKNRETKGS